MKKYILVLTVAASACLGVIKLGSGLSYQPIATQLMKYKSSDGTYNPDEYHKLSNREAGDVIKIKGILLNGGKQSQKDKTDLLKELHKQGYNELDIQRLMSYEYAIFMVHVDIIKQQAQAIAVFMSEQEYKDCMVKHSKGDKIVIKSEYLTSFTKKDDNGYEGGIHIFFNGVEDLK